VSPLESLLFLFQNLLLLACFKGFQIIPRPVPIWIIGTYHKNMIIWKKNSLKSGEFGTFFCMKNTLYRLKSYFSGQNLVKFRQEKKSLFMFMMISTWQFLASSVFGTGLPPTRINISGLPPTRINISLLWWASFIGPSKKQLFKLWAVPN